MPRPDPSPGRPVTTEAPAAKLAGAAAHAPGDGASRSTARRHVEPQGGARALGVVAPGASGPRPVSVTVWRRVDAGVDEAFDVVVPIDLPSVFGGFGPVPAVVATEGAAGTWGRAAGQSRTVLLAGGGRLRETVLQRAAPGLFRYEVVPERGVLRYLVRSIEGRFVFSESEAGGTVIRWTYVFRPRGGARIAALLLAPIWRRYAADVIDRLADAVRAHGARAAGASTEGD